MNRRDFLSNLIVSPLMVGTISGAGKPSRDIVLPSWRGECVLTAYCPCSLCCGPGATGFTSLGKRPTQGYTVAADPKFFRYGTHLYIEGVGIRVVSDCGGAIQGSRLDIYFDNHDDALEFGKVRRKVRVVKHGR